MAEPARDKPVVFTKVSCSDETRSTCHGTEDDDLQTERTPNAVDGMAVSDLTRNLLTVLRVRLLWSVHRGRVPDMSTQLTGWRSWISRGIF